jgi:hypothetical protein
MKIVINLVLVAIIAALAYLLWVSIQEPIGFKEELDKRRNAVVDRLIILRHAQEFYREITGEYASSFDTLAYVLENEDFRTIKVLGDPDDPTGQGVIYDTIYTPARDTLRALGWNIDSLKYVPFGEGEIFSIAADTITHQQTLVPVVEVGTRWNVFMGRYADDRFSRYDDRYNPNAVIKFGDMNSPNTSGNWE